MRNRLAAPLCFSVALLAATPAVPQQLARDRARFADEARKLTEQFGGPYTGPGVAVVQRVGRQMAAATGVSPDGRDCTITVLNSDVVNALALPGCYIYVTRGLMAIMNDEAELASVLGHELGHVAGQHGQKRQNTATLAGILGLAAGVLTGSNAVGSLAGQVGQLGVLSYSRGQEYDADQRGMRALVKAGYDPWATADMLDSLARDEQIKARARGRDPSAGTPAFLRTHPLTQDRVRRAEADARRTGLQPGQRRRDAQAYLTAIDGMTYGDDPAQGFVDGRRFIHPTLRIAFTAPQGWQIQNSPEAVVMQGPSGAQAQFSGGRLRPGEPIDAYAERVAQALTQGRARYGEPIRDQIGGVAAAVVPLRAQSNRGAVDVLVAAYRVDADSAYQFVTITPSGRDGGEAEQIVRSFRRLGAGEAQGARGRIVDTVAVRPGDTVESLGRQMAYSDLPVERFLALNDLDPRDGLRPGQMVKIIRYAGGR